MLKGIMLQGTASDVGKSVIATALCRIFADKGYRIAPFKSQNMSTYTCVTRDGKEIARSQWIQAEAAKTAANVYMNPILLKPRGDQTSEVVFFGKTVGTFSGKEYRDDFYEQGLQAIKRSLSELKKTYDVLVIEGAGSPVEINLNDRELVNMKVAQLADVPVLLVAGIERGGVFASIVGTLELLHEADRARVKGIIINKFLGDIELFQNGIDWLEERANVPVLGVVPYYSEMMIEAEDSLSQQLTQTHRHSSEQRDIAYKRFAEHVSRYVDIEQIVSIMNGWRTHENQAAR